MRLLGANSELLNTRIEELIRENPSREDTAIGITAIRETGLAGKVTTEGARKRVRFMRDKLKLAKTEAPATSIPQSNLSESNTLQSDPAQSEEIRDDQHGNDRTLSSKSLRITTVEQLLAKAEIDLQVWEVERKIVNQWEVGVKTPEGSIIVEPLYQIKVWLKRQQKKVDLLEFKERVIAEMKSYAPLYKLPPTRNIGSYLLEISPFDLHIGKLAWQSETGSAPYDSKIASDLLKKSMEDLVEKSKGYPAERILFVIGNDLLHTDSSSQTTTHGTRQDADSRHHKMFRCAEDVMKSAIDMLRLIAPVTVLVVPGNHDQDSAFKLGEYLSAWYHKDSRVDIDNEPTLRKYYRYGTTLLGFTHGCYEKHDSLPLIMADERPQDWAETKYRAWHIGHYHTKRETKYNAGNTYGGVRVQILPSLSGTDAWHAQQGYVNGPRAIEARIFSKRGGEEAMLTFNYFED